MTVKELWEVCRPVTHVMVRDRAGETVEYVGGTRFAGERVRKLTGRGWDCGMSVVIAELEKGGAESGAR